MYEVQNNMAKIDGYSGIYDGKVKNSSVRYGRNALDNYKSYVDDLDNSSYPPLEFEYRYLPKGKVDTLALMGNAYEELGKKTKVKTEDLNKELEDTVGNNFSADALDLNKDGYVDIAEYATDTLTQDALSSVKGGRVMPENVNGVITAEGQDKATMLLARINEKSAERIYSNLYNEFDLASAQKKFLADKNNME